MRLVDRPILGQQPSASARQALAYLARGNPALPAADASDIVAAYWAVGLEVGIDPAAALAQSCHETNGYRFGGQVGAAQHNVAGIGATNDGAAGLAWPTWAAGIRAHYAHLLAWCGDARGNTDPRWSLVRQAAKAKGNARTWADLGGRWAVPGVGYGDGIERHWQAILREGGSTMVEKPAMIIDHTKSKFGGYARGERRQLLICSHITGGSDSLAWLRDVHIDPRTGQDTSPSVNYLIRRDGTIIEIVDPHGPAPWTNGIDYAQYPQGKRPNLANPLIADLTRQQISPNQWTVTIEHEGLNGEQMTAAQWDATTRLQAWLCQEFAITPDPIHIIGHFEIDSIDRPNCPGWTGDQWDTLQANIRAMLAGDGQVTAQEASVKPAPAPQPVPDPAQAEAAALKSWAEANTTFAGRGYLKREGVVDLREFGGAQAERLAVYERVVAHRLAGRNYVMTLDAWDELRRQRRVVLY